MRPAFHMAQRMCGRRPARGVEVGVASGINARVCLDEWPDLYLYLVEADPKQEGPIHARLLGVQHAYELHIGDSVVVANTFASRPLDIVYLDDDHSYAGITRSLAAWFPRVRIGGMIAGHDYHFGDVKRGVDEFFAKHGMDLNLEGWDWWGIRVG